ncbi:MAG: hypothetical protein AAFS10_18690 [Myxococcota bacterium]
MICSSAPFQPWPTPHALVLVSLLSVSVALVACSDDSDSTSDTSDDTGAAEADTGVSGDDTATPEGDTTDETDPIEEPRVGFEILQVVSPNELVVWLGRDLTQDEFNAIDLPEGWIKNQPREGEPDESAFARSPDAAAEGEFTDAEHFGHSWRHNATVIEANTPLDDDGLLRLNRIAKFHEIRFNAGRTLFVLVSPEGELFVRISRDANRTRETPTLPSGWQIVEHTIDEELVFDLPNPTMNIRGDNEDSFQGPVPELDGMIDVQVTSPGLELSPTLCDDPSHLAPLLESIQASDGDDAFGGVNEEQLQRMLMAPTDGPFYMFNLIRYRDQAVYPDGRDTDLTGREANALYSPTEFIQAIGARIVFNTAVHDQIDGDDVLWDDIAIVEYPCPLAFLGWGGGGSP